MGGLNSKHFPLTAVEAEIQDKRMGAGPFRVRFTDDCLLVVTSRGRRGRPALQGLSEGPSSQSPPKGSTLDTITLGDGLQCVACRRPPTPSLALPPRQSTRASTARGTRTALLLLLIAPGWSDRLSPRGKQFLLSFITFLFGLTAPR